MNLIVEDEDKKFLKKYNINVEKYKNLKDLLVDIDAEMTKYVDEHDEPLKEFIELERVYDRIYYANK